MTDTATRPMFNLDSIQWVTAIVVTQNSHYLVIARPGWVKVVLTDTTGERPPWSPQVGMVLEGASLLHIGSTLHLIDANGHAVMRTSRVLDVRVIEN